MASSDFKQTGEIPFTEVQDDLEGESHTGDFTSPDGAIAGLAELAALDTTEETWTLTILKGSEIGQIWPLSRRTVIGRGAGADIQLTDSKLSREHAVFTCRDKRLYVTDLESRNGTYVEGQQVSANTELEDGAHVQIGQTLVRAQIRNRAEVEAAAALYESSLRDPLTGLYNRRHLDEQLGAELAYALRHRVSLTAMLLDLDHFKEINDERGHLAGDEVLRAFSADLTRTLRREDLAARYGGDEFVILCRGIGAQGAEILAQRIRADIEALEIVWRDEPIRITTSIGVATSDPTRPYASGEGLLQAADRCLYRAKGAGRNLVICDASPRSSPPV